MAQGHHMWDQNELNDEKPGAKNLVRLSLFSCCLPVIPPS